MTPIIDKVRKLLALASSSNVHEAAAAAAKAAQIMDEHKLSMVDVHAPADEIASLEADKLPEIPTWRAVLLHYLATHYDCESVYTNREDGMVATLIGGREDAEMVRVMYAWLTVELVRLADLDMSTINEHYRHSFLMGGVMGIRESLNAQRDKTLEKMANANALLRLDQQKARVHEEVLRQFPDIGETTVQPVVDMTAAQRGMQAGRGVHLGKALEGAVPALPAKEGA